MKKEDILAKSRAEGKDEMEIVINQKSSYVGIVVLFLSCLFFAATKVLNNGEPFFEFPAILFAYISGMNAYSFYRLKKPSYLGTSISFAFAFICMTILYFMNR